MQDSTRSALLSPPRVKSLPKRQNWAPFLLSLGAAAPIVAALAINFQKDHWTLPHAKLLLLATQFFVLLPSLVFALRLDRRSRSEEKRAGWATRFQLPGALLVYSALLLPLAFNLGLGRYQGDESAYLFEARCLATGHLSATQPNGVPHEALSFAHHLFIDRRWLGKYPPGWPVVLSLMTMVHTEWLLNPTLGLLLLWITYEFGRRTFGRAEGLTATVMLATSAFMVLNCLGFMSHVLCAVLIAVAVACFAQAVKRSMERGSDAYWTIGMIVILISAEFVRPFTALCAGAALIAALHFRPQWRAIGALVGWMAVFAVLTGLVVACQNYLFTGNPLHTAYSAYNHGQLNEVSLRPQHLLFSLAKLTPIRLVDTASVSFPFILPLALYGLWRRRQNRVVWGVFLVFLSLVVGHLVQLDDSDSPIGERYYFESYFALALVAAIGAVQLAADLRLSLRMQRQVGIALVAASLAAVLVSTGWEIRLRQPSERVVEAMQRVPFKEGIVFVKGSAEFPAFNWNFNDPQSGILELIDPGPTARAAVAKAAGAQHWISLRYDPQSGWPVWIPAEK